MAGEGKLFLRGEDADTHGVVARRCCVRPGADDEGGFGEVGLAGKRLHLFRGEIAAIVEDGERVALEGAFGEDVEEGVVERMGHEERVARGDSRCADCDFALSVSNAK
jgi:hypothetical protein